MSDKKMVQKVIHSTNAQTLTHAAQGIERISVRPCIDSLPRQLFFPHVSNTIMVVCAVHKASERGILRFARLNERRSYWRTAIQTRMRFITTQLGRKLQVQNRISTPKRKKDDFEALFKRIFKRKITSAKMEEICWQITVAAFMQPLQYDLWSPAAKDNSITHAAKRGSNTCNPIYIAVQSWLVHVQKTLWSHVHPSWLACLLLYAQLVRLAIGVLPTLLCGVQSSHPFFTLLGSWGCGCSACASLRLAGAFVWFGFPRLVWGWWGSWAFWGCLFPWCGCVGSCCCGFGGCCCSPSSVRCLLGGSSLLKVHTPFTLRERSYSCKAQWKSIGNSSTSNTCNPIYIAGRILQLQITMEFHRQPIQEHHLQSHLHCGNDPTVANHNGILSTTHARKTVDTPFTMRNRSEHDPSMIRTYPTTHETVSHPSHRRGRSSRFGDGLCMEKHRVSCICYLSKTHFVRDFLQNSIGNSSTSTTCNAIYSEGTILQLQITMPWLTLSLTNSFFDNCFFD